VPSEQIGEAQLLSALVAKAIVLGFTARRQRAAQGGDALYVPAKLDLLGEERGARLAVFRSFVGIGLAAFTGELGSGSKGFSGHRCFLRPMEKRSIERWTILLPTAQRRHCSAARPHSRRSGSGQVFTT
jgi:hypothetical protein